LRLNLVEVWRIGWKKEEMGSLFFNGFSCLRGLMESPVIQDHPIIFFRDRDKALSHPSIENSGVRVTLESKGCLNFLLAISGNDSSSGMSYFS